MKKLFIPPVLVLISLILIVLYYFVIPFFNVIPYPFNLAGILLEILGVAIIGKTNQLFLRHKTTRTLNKSTHLLTEGTFSKSRNPMYAGMFLFLMGTGICFRNLFSMLTPFGFIIIVYLVFVRIEEKLMTETFGQEYLDYKKKVRRWF